MNHGEQNYRGRNDRGNRASGFPVRREKTAKGHDAQLKDAQENGKPICLTTMAGETIRGNIVSRDRYTVTVRAVNTCVIYYKHAIESIQIIEPTAES